MHRRQSVAPSQRVLLVAIVATYITIGVLYAALTPTWQVPDEPAHYNYIRALADDRDLPILEPGDYDQAYLERLKSERFPPELSIAPIEYEDHQPPLYYLLATPVYRLFGSAVLPLRLISVALGALLLLVAWGTVRATFPARPELALVATAFIAFIPQHVAMTAGVNNDALAELVVGGTLWALVVYVGGGHDRPWPVGLLLAVALLTKTTAYIVVGVAVVAVLIRWRRERQTWGWATGQLAWMLIPALLISAPWFIRNGLVYGWNDPLGLARHNQVVEGQLRTSEYLALDGWAAYWERAWRFTFQSFWGQFGWLGVVLPARIYKGLALFSALLCAGFIAWLLQQRHPSQSANPPIPSLLLFALSATLTFFSFAWLNLSFVQHQGRYFFPALIPIGTAAALGLSTLARILPQRLRPWAIAALFAGLAALDVYCLFRFIIPLLAR
ncbi:MAG: glycosyltransferase family 39 protein [Chloroflexota bacterium]|nr:glycosyltransferase family 39 protein [Chloroflexota bacterium]